MSEDFFLSEDFHEKIFPEKCIFFWDVPNGTVKISLNKLPQIVDSFERLFLGIF